MNLIYNNDYNDYKFFLVFRNQYIRFEITKQLKRYKYLNRVYIIDSDKNKNLNQFSSMNELLQFKHIDYITIINYDINIPFKYDIQLPSNIKSIEFNERFRQRLNPGDIPLTIESLSISDYRYKLNHGIITNNIKYLSLGVFNRELEIGVLPQSLISLSLPDYKHEFTIGILPNSIESLSFLSYNQIFNLNVLPSSLKTLKLEFTEYDQELIQHALPQSLTSLSIDGYRYKFKENDLPSNLTNLSLKDYNQQLINLPNSLLILSLSNSDVYYSNNNNNNNNQEYNNKIKTNNKLPKSLIKLLINGNNIL